MTTASRDAKADRTLFPVWQSLTPSSSWHHNTPSAVGCHGLRIEFDDETSALDATSGLWNVPLGYGNTVIAEAVHDSLIEASYLSLFRNTHAPAVNAAEALLSLGGRHRFRRVVFSTSGGAANDLAMKLVRQRSMLLREPRRTIVVGLQGSYHGLTYGSMSLSGDNLGQSVYGSDQRNVRHVTPHDGGAQLRRLMAREGGRVAALVVEPVLGSGAFALADEFLATIGELRETCGFLVVADEVATGFGRTGTLFGSDRWPFDPDIMLLSKALTNGTCAAAAALVSPHITAAFDDSDAVFVHAETQAGTPATCAAIIATINEFDRLDAVRRAAELSWEMDNSIERLNTHRLVVGSRGRGCFRAVMLGRDGRDLTQVEVAAVVAAVRTAGAVVQPGPSCIQLIPAFLFERSHLYEIEAAVTDGLDILERYEEL